ncbi:O-fucosyltransferase 30 [Humulus lupulus]|uniref:O-fucosyltransferase 30 n=1 Tax=Humulus lupulus TaxID=3486 RepID=UPI002B40E018|nr:O-fucosyltransferase 30 [Humulus lupulus]
MRVMNLLNPNRAMATRPSPWPFKRPSSLRSPLLSLAFLFCILLFLPYYFLTPKSLLSKTSSRCNSYHGQKFLWYAPHSGFSNQLSEFKNALLMSAILNRTLLIPPILDHHAVALGSCPKFRVLEPNQIRNTVWDHVVDLIRTKRYVSMADIIDISSLVSSSLVRVIDFRIFASSWCNLDIDSTCFGELGWQYSLFDSLKQCGSFLSGLDGSVTKCLYAVDEDCRTTVWTYQNGNEDGALDSFQPDKQLKRKKKIAYVRRRQDVYKHLGPGSEADSATVLAFGSLFTAPYKGSESYIDIHESLRDQRIQNLIEKIEFLPFVPEIISAGKKFAHETIQAPFLCAQLRLLDGQFKNHWKTTFLGLKQKIESLGQSVHPIHIFVMTDLPEANWTESYLGDLAEDSRRFKLFFLKESDQLIVQTSKRLVEGNHGMSFGFPSGTRDIDSKATKHCRPSRLPDVLLYMEETVCSCASLGFVGTSGSTIAESIELMRKFGEC